jgi:hypothetical protein
MPIYAAIPIKLKKQVRKLIEENKIENVSDKKWAAEALENSPESTESTIVWLKKLVERNGAKFTV